MHELTNFQHAANNDPEVFPEPSEVRLDRPLDSYIPFGVGPQAALGKETSIIALTSMLRVVGGLDNLRRAPGPQGQLKKVAREEGYTEYLREDNSSYFPFPMSKLLSIPIRLYCDPLLTCLFSGVAFKVHFDGEIPERRSI